jgi:predicted RNA polymerase sigma factor
MGGLSTAEIARAYLKPEATIAQRIVRAKRSLAAARVPCEVPRGAELVARLDSVLEVIYLIFNEGYAATAGEDWMRPALAEEAQRLGRVLASLLPDQGGAGPPGPDGDPGLARRPPVASGSRCC